MNPSRENSTIATYDILSELQKRNIVAVDVQRRLGGAAFRVRAHLAAAVLDVILEKVPSLDVESFEIEVTPDSYQGDAGQKIVFIMQPRFTPGLPRNLFGLTKSVKEARTDIIFASGGKSIADRRCSIWFNQSLSDGIWRTRVSMPD